MTRLAAVVWLCALGFSCLSCGVRGKPQPPLSPPDLGRGQPTFKRATEEFAFPNVPNPNASPTPAGKPSFDPRRGSGEAQ